MSYTFEKTFAPSDDVSNFAARKLGWDLEWPIWIDYLNATKAPINPPGNEAPNDWRDSSDATDYTKLLIIRHGDTIDQKELEKDRRIKDALRVPDISTYNGRFVPPRILGVDISGRAIEDRSRHEYYEIKPNSDDGEDKGIKKLKSIAASYKRYGLFPLYQPGKTYPLNSQTYIDLTWGAAFEYLKLIFMWENNIKKCDLDLHVIRHPDHNGLLMYAIRIRIAMDVQLAIEKMRALVAGVVFAFGLCSVAGCLGLSVAIPGISEAAKLVAELAKELAEETPPGLPANPAGPRVPPFDEVPDELPPSQRKRVPSLPPEELPDIPIDLEDYDVDEECLPKWKKAVAAAIIGRGYGLPGKKLDIFCDEDFFQNNICDRTTADRFVSMARLALPLSPTITASTAYLQIALPKWRDASVLIDQIDKRLPNQLRLQIRERIPKILQTIVALPAMSQVTMVSHILFQTAGLASFINPILKQNTRKHSATYQTGKIALPEEILSRWKGCDASVGAKKTPFTLDGLVANILGPNVNEMNFKYLKDALKDNTDILKFALDASPGFTLAIGAHVLYKMNKSVTTANRYGDYQGANLSRMFAVTVRDGVAKPGKCYDRIPPSKVAIDSESSDEKYRYLGRVKIGRR